MKIAIIGAGAIGGLLGFRLSAADHDVTLVARGAHLAALQDRGTTLIDESGETATRKVNAADHLPAGRYDAVILAMKAHQVADVVEGVAAALSDDTIVVTAQNGIPWWYFQKLAGPHEGSRVESVDPGGIISSHLPIANIVGSVVYPAAEIVSPGVIKHVEGNRFSIGEIDGSDTPRIRALSEALRESGFKAPVLADIRTEIWTKLWGNLSLNPISALTHATLVDICQDPPARALVTRMMQEAQSVAETLGVRFRVSLEKRIAGAEAVGAHKTSMLQDVEAGKQIELDALVGSVAELGRIAGVPTPTIDGVYALANLLAATLRNQGGSLKLQTKSDRTS